MAPKKKTDKSIWVVEARSRNKDPDKYDVYWDWLGEDGTILWHGASFKKADRTMIMNQYCICLILFFGSGLFPI